MADTVIITGEKTVTVVTVGVQGPAGVSGSSVPATNTTLGGIIVGDNLTITGNGVLSAQPGGVTAFNNRTGNVSLTSNDVTSALTYTPLTSTTPYGNMSFTGTSADSPFNLRLSNSNGSRTVGINSSASNYVYGNGTVVPWGANLDVNWVINNPRANGQVDTYYPFLRLFTDRSFPDVNEAGLGLYYNYTPNATTGPYYNSSLRVYKTKLEFFASSYTWTDNSVLTRFYADTRYLTSANLTPYLTTATAAATYLTSANLTYANLTGTPTTLAGYGITDGYSTSNPSGYITAGANSFTGAQNLQDNELIRAKLRDYSETVSSPTISAGTLVLNLETSNIFTVSLNAAITTLTISNPPASGSGGSFTLILTADGTARSVTWPASIKWAGGTAPTITSASGKVDSFAFFTSDGGTNWQGYIGGQNF